MIDVIKIIKITSVFIIFTLMYPLPARSETQFVNIKMLGKLTMVAILSTTAFIIKKLVDRDIKETAKIRENLGSPDRVIEFQEGFDHWRIEWHANYIYAFRNGLFSYRREVNSER